MKAEKSIIINFIFNFLKTLSTLLFPVITFTYSARILGVAGIGKVSFARSVTTYFTMFAMLGMNYYGTREAAKVRDDKDKLSGYVHEMLMVNGITTVFAYMLLSLSIYFVPRLQGYSTLLLINSASILLQGMGMEWLYQGLEEYRYIAARSVLFQTAALVAMLVFVKTADDVVAYAIIYTIATSGSYVLNFINARKYISFQWYGNYKIKKHIKPLLWLFAMAVSIELYTVLDSTMLGFLKGDEAVGMYTAAVKVNRLTNTLITSLGVVLIPRLSYYIGLGQMEYVKKLIDKTYNFVFLLSVPACVGLFMLSDEIILLFSGTEFASAGMTMRILTPIVLVIPFSVVTNQQTFVPMGKEKLILISTCAGAVTNFICNLILIPQFAENGAAVATVLAEIVVAIVCFINAKGLFSIGSIFKNYYQYWIAALPIPMIAWWSGMLSMHYVLRMILIVTISIIAYFGILLFFKNQYMEYAVIALRNRLQRK